MVDKPLKSKSRGLILKVMEMVHYRIQKRKFSANIIEKGVAIDGKISWSPYLGIFHNKKEADPTTEKIIEFLKTL